MELLRFLAGIFVLTAPGIALAFAVGFGKSRLERCVHGACLGLAGGIYLATAISHINLRLFYPAWGAVAIAALAVIPAIRRKSAPRALTRESSDGWVWLVLLLVALTRLGIALPQTLPKGVDPPVGLILAEKIQLAQHSVSDWQPFDDAELVYPTGGHTLLVVLSGLSGLPLHTVAKNFLAMLGVFSTAQVWLLAWRVTENGRAALFAAMAYGMWAGVGSIDFYNWGGWPNELAMVLFVAMLTAILQPAPRHLQITIASVCLAAMVLSHHHTQIACGAVILAIIGFSVIQRDQRPRASVFLLTAAAAFLFDLPLIAHYLAAASTLGSTNSLHNEAPLTMSPFLPWMGCAFLLAAAAGFGFSLARRAERCDLTLPIACGALIALFIICEYILPHWFSPPAPRRLAALSPGHFLNDLAYFLAAYAGVAIAAVQRRLKLATSATLAGMLVISATQWQVWREAATPVDLSADFLQACRWVREKTPAGAVLYGDSWASYFSWRRSPAFLLPDSERHENRHTLAERLPEIMAGNRPPDSADMIVLKIEPVTDAGNHAILWRSPGGLAVVKLWPQQ